MSFRPSAALHNKILALLRRAQINAPIPRVRAAIPFAHPWQVSVDRASLKSASGAGRLQPWQIDVATAAVNDIAVTIPYRRTVDPREWELPTGYVVDPASSPAPWLDRDLLDVPDDPPFLLAGDPPAAATAHPDWTLVTEDARGRLEGGAFTGRADWASFPELWRSSVILSATPLKVQFLGVEYPPPTLQRFRLYQNRAAPGLNFAPESGGAMEVATLYLLRDPHHPENGEVRVRQRLFWPLASAIVQPGADIIAGLQLFADNDIDIFTALLASEVLNQATQILNTGTAQALFWSV